LAGVAVSGAAIAACTPAAPQVVEVEKPVVVEKEVVKEVPVEKVVEKEVEVVVTATPAARAAEKPVVRWQFAGGARYQTAAEEGANTFNDMQDEIVLLVELRPPNTFEKLMAAMVAGVAPDVFEYWGLWFAKLHQKGQLKDVQPLCDADLSDDWIAGFVTHEWENFSRLSFIPGKRVAMPRYINFMWLHYNKRMLDEGGVDYPDAGWTVDDMADAAARLTQRNADGTVDVYGMNFPSWVMERMFYHLERFGGAFVRHEEPKKCLMNMPESQEALEWLRKRYWEDQTWAEPLLTNRSWGVSVFENEYVAMAEEGGPHYTHRIACETLDTDFMHPPNGPVRRSSYLVTDGYGLWSGSHYPDAAWEVMKYVSDDINQEIRQRITGQFSTRLAVVRKWPQQVVELTPCMEGMNLDVGVEALEMGYGTDDERFFCQAEAEEIINPLLEKVYVVGDAPVSILADACPQVEAAMTCEAI